MDRMICLMKYTCTWKLCFQNIIIHDYLFPIIGLMCLPPMDSDSNSYFQTLKKTSEKLNLNELSMGMSSDYERAVFNGSTYLRLGTVIFGERST